MKRPLNVNQSKETIYFAKHSISRRKECEKCKWIGLRRKEKRKKRKRKRKNNVLRHAVNTEQSYITICDRQ